MNTKKMEKIVTKRMKNMTDEERKRYYDNMNAYFTTDWRKKKTTKNVAKKKKAD